jgi:CheY-like chemotaxis protein
VGFSKSSSKEIEMKILVIDDSPVHLRAAEAQLAGHDLTVVESYAKAQEALGVRPSEEVFENHSFDVVLVDLLIPASRYGLAPEAMDFAGKEMPIGIFLALLAAKHGARYVAVHTDSDHHSHPASTCFDAFNPHRDGWVGERRPTSFTVEGARVLLSNNREWIGGGGKRWDLLLEYLLKE